MDNYKQDLLGKNTADNTVDQKIALPFYVMLILHLVICDKNYSKVKGILWQFYKLGLKVPSGRDETDGIGHFAELGSSWPGEAKTWPKIALRYVLRDRRPPVPQHSTFMAPPVPQHTIFHPVRSPTRWRTGAVRGKLGSVKSPVTPGVTGEVRL